MYCSYSILVCSFSIMFFHSISIVLFCSFSILFSWIFILLFSSILFLLCSILLLLYSICVLFCSYLARLCFYFVLFYSILFYTVLSPFYSVAIHFHLFPLFYSAPAVFCFCSNLLTLCSAHILLYFYSIWLCYVYHSYSILFCSNLVVFCSCIPFCLYSILLLYSYPILLQLLFILVKFCSTLLCSTLMFYTEQYYCSILLIFSIMFYTDLFYTFCLFCSSFSFLFYFCCVQHLLVWLVSILFYSSLILPRRI